MSVFLVDCNECFSLFLTESRFLFGVSSRMTLWEQISINFAVLINLLVAFFYPFSDGPGGKRLLEIISVDCQIVFPLLSAFYCAVHLARACPPLSRAHPLSRFPYFLFSFLARIGFLASHIS